MPWLTAVLLSVKRQLKSYLTRQFKQSLLDGIQAHRQSFICESLQLELWIWTGVNLTKSIRLWKKYKSWLLYAYLMKSQFQTGMKLEWSMKQMDLYRGGVCLRCVNVSDNYLIRFWHRLFKMSEEINLSDNTSQISKSASFLSRWIGLCKILTILFFPCLDTFFVELKNTKTNFLSWSCNKLDCWIWLCRVLCKIMTNIHSPSFFRHLFCWQNTRLFTILSISFVYYYRSRVILAYSKLFIWRESINGAWLILSGNGDTGYFVRILHFCRQFWNVLVVILYYSG